MSIIVQKYGGSSVATAEHLARIADAVVKRADTDRLVLVVSAMGDATDDLLARARQVAKEPRGRELDMLLTVGERITMSLLALAMRERGAEAVSLTGSQCGIMTTASHNDARIMEVRPFRVQDELQKGRIVIVAGYQGVSYQRDITTLGRGGSDTTAVALAAALGATCEINSDVAGEYSADPRVVPEAKPLAELGYEEMQAMARQGAKVLNAQAVAFARDKGIALYARKTGSDAPGTVIRTNAPLPPTGVRGVAHRNQVVHVEAAAEYIDAVWGELEARSLRPVDYGFSGERASWVLDPDAVGGTEGLRTALPEAQVFDDRGSVALVGHDVWAQPRIARAFFALAPNRFASTGSGAALSVVVPREAVSGLAQAAHAQFCTT